MAATITKADVWIADLPDAPGALAAKLRGLAQAGADLDFLVGRRQPDKPGMGIAFVTGVKGVKASKAASAAGFEKSATIGALRVEGTNKAGAVYNLLAAIAAAGITLRGVGAQTIGKKFAATLAFDSHDDAKRAAAALKKAKV
jgi:prephenate dehydratase